MIEYDVIVQDVLEYGNERSTRSGDTISLFNITFEHSMCDGFPALTSKKMAFKACVGELMMFLSGTSDRRIMQEYIHGDFKEERFDIWKDDCVRKSKTNPNRFNGYNLGDMYPTYFRQLYCPSNEYITFKRKEDLDWDYEITTNKVDMKTTRNHELSGCVIESKKSGKYVVGDGVYDTKKQCTLFDVQFIHTGTIVSNVAMGIVKSGLIKDYKYRSVFGVGYVDAPRYATDKISRLWRSMLERCYNPKASAFAQYGGIGVTVSPRWHSLKNFCDDVYSLPNFQKWVNNTNAWSLDKDYYSGKVYSRNTCIFIPKELNSKLSGTKILIDEQLFYSISDAESYLDIARRGDLSRVEERGGVVIEDTDILHRNVMFIDQLQNLIDSVKNDPYSRYHVVDNWNINHETTAVLGSCHTNFQVYVNDGVLDLHWNQRSVDVALGLPFNIMSYALMLKILAKLTGLRAGTLSATLLDTHIYKAHEELIREQIQRTKFDLPDLILPEFETLDDLLELTAKDFKLVNYKHHDSIKFPLLVG